MKCVLFVCNLLMFLSICLYVAILKQFLELQSYFETIFLFNFIHFLYVSFFGFGFLRVFCFILEIEVVNVSITTIYAQVTQDLTIVEIFDDIERILSTFHWFLLFFWRNFHFKLKFDKYGQKVRQFR